MKKISNRILVKAIKAINAKEKRNVTIDSFLDAEFKGYPKERSAVSDLLFSLYRNKTITDALIRSLAKKVKPAMRVLLETVLTQCFFQEGIAPESAVNIAVDYTRKRYGSKQAGFINAVTRNALKTDLNFFRAGLSGSEQANLPSLVYDRWMKNFGQEKTLELAEFISKPAPVTFRSLKKLPMNVKKQVGAEKLNLPEWASGLEFYRCGSVKDLINSGLFKNGEIYIQDPSTVVAPLMAPDNLNNGFILDLCSAPGGKSRILYERFGKCFLTASDISPRRQKTTFLNFKTNSVDAAVIAASALKPPFANQTFSLVMADVPCSNTGTARRRPDVLWSFSEKGLSELSETQYRILEAAFDLCCRGGYVIYSTCSIEPEENFQLVNSFLDSNLNAELIKEIRLFPDSLNDGVYCALIARKE